MEPKKKLNKPPDHSEVIARVLERIRNTPWEELEAMLLWRPEGIEETDRNNEFSRYQDENGEPLTLSKWDAYRRKRLAELPELDENGFVKILRLAKTSLPTKASPECSTKGVLETDRNGMLGKEWHDAHDPNKGYKP